MRYEIVQPSGAAKKGDVVWIACEIDNFGCFRIRVTDADGNARPCGCLATLTRDGRIGRVLGVDPDLGFQLDKNGRIKIIDED